VKSAVREEYRESAAARSVHWWMRGRRDIFARMLPLPFGLNGVLHRLFAAEARWLVRHDLPIGVSLLALARPGS
jgi:hypothetical protein